MTETSLLSLQEHETIQRAQHGERTAMDHLLRKYRRLVQAKARCFAGFGTDLEDLTQIGMIGLWHAIMEFRHEYAVSFSSYAALCIRRQLITAIKPALRRKRQPTGSRIPFGLAVTEESHFAMLTQPDALVHSDPVQALLERESFGEMCSALRYLLTDFEWQVLLAHQAGKSYREIAEEMACAVKAVDNALGRIRRKVHSIASAPAELCAWLVAERTGPSSARNTAQDGAPVVRRQRRRRVHHGLRAAQAAL